MPGCPEGESQSTGFIRSAVRSVEEIIGTRSLDRVVVQRHLKHCSDILHQRQVRKDAEIRVRASRQGVRGHVHGVGSLVMLLELRDTLSLWQTQVRSCMHTFNPSLSHPRPLYVEPMGPCEGAHSFTLEAKSQTGTKGSKISATVGNRSFGNMVAVGCLIV